MPVVPNLHAHNILLIPHNRPVRSFHTPIIQLSICDAVAGIDAAEGEVLGSASVRETDIRARTGKVVRRAILHRFERGAREARDERGAAVDMLEGLQTGGEDRRALDV